MMSIGGEVVITQRAEEPLAADLAVEQGNTVESVHLPTFAAVAFIKGITALRAESPGAAVPVVVLGPAVGTAGRRIHPGRSLVALGDGRLVELQHALDFGLVPGGAVMHVVGFSLTGADTEDTKFDLLVCPSLFVVR